MSSPTENHTAIALQDVAISRDLDQARDAFQSGDLDASRQAHEAKGLIVSGSEAHRTEQGQYVKSVILGGLDGIITTFAIVAGVQGANMSVETVLVLGFANLIADGISMGVGDYLSEKGEHEYIHGERKREQWEFDNYPQGEKQEMIELYQQKGFSQDDATSIIDIMARNPKFFVDHMMVEELGLMTPDGDENPAKNGFVTFLSFLAFGIVPLIGYIVMASAGLDDWAFLVSCILTVLTLLGLGVFKARISGVKASRSALEVLGNGVAAAGASFLIAFALSEALGVRGSH